MVPKSDDILEERLEVAIEPKTVDAIFSAKTLPATPINRATTIKITLNLDFINSPNG